MLKRILASEFVRPREEQKSAPCLERRGFLRGAVLTAGGVVASTPVMASFAEKKERRLSFYNKHTGEMARVVYWAPDTGYIGQSLAEVSYVLRDHRTDEVKAIDPGLLDQM